MTMRLLIALFISTLSANLLAQKAPNFFQPVSLDEVVLPETAQRELEPLHYLAYRLDYEALVALLRQAPREFSAAANQRALVVSLPTANGAMEDFSILKTSAMDPELEAQHPEILTLSATAVNKPGMLARITVTPYWGMRIMIARPDKERELIQPVALGQNLFYMVYDANHEPRDPMMAKLITGTDPNLDLSYLKEQDKPRFSLGEPVPSDGNRLETGNVKLKMYKFACACTGEFSQDNGGNKDAVFQKVTSVTNSLNLIYERDLNIRLLLIPESYDIIFLDPATDPYPGSTVGEWMNANPLAMLNVLGSADKYDVGHVFARFITGNAIGVAGGYCCTQSKGRGCSAGNIPYGDYFFSVVGQEIGHMWGGWHTWNKCDETTEPFPDIDRCEPGSGNTIMSYHNACGSDNTGGQGSLYYHTCSISTIRRFVEQEQGATCGTEEVTPNNKPIATTAHPKSLIFIPISTPFTLSGSAIDPDGDVLNYCWDQIDIGPPSSLGQPTGNAPSFIWLPPSPNPSRTFPRIQTVIANNSTATEVLPTYNRDLTFVLVARDDKPGGGGLGFDTVNLRSTTTAGPFLVSYPNLASTVWNVGEYQTVTWNVANTNNSLVNCQQVNIKLSLDGGMTYPVTLASNQPNIGRACIQVPNNITTTARIRVEAADNVFFDISNASFRIQQPTAAGFSICANDLVDFVCLPAGFSTEISSTAIGGFSEPLSLSATGLPNGATATFSPNPVPAGGSSTLTITLPPDAVEETFNVTVMGSAGAESSISVITLTTIQNDFSSVAPTAPANGASGVNTRPLLQWSTAIDADAYDVELATNPSFDPQTIVATKPNSATPTFQITTDLAEGGVYFWRVRPKNACGEGEWTETQVFVVTVLSCVQLSANDLPQNLSPNGTPTIESKITLPSGGLISDLNVTKVQGFHDYFRDLEVRLISPTGTDVLIWKDRCGSFSGNFNIRFDDGASSVFACPPPNNNSVSKSTNPLSTFNGENASGTWTLRVKDNYVSSGGTIAAFDLQICSNEATNPPVITVNNVLQPAAGTNTPINVNFLKAEDSNNSAEQLLFTLITVPQNGLLKNNNVSLQVGSQFTQADIDNGLLVYFDYGLNAGSDAFRFVVSDGEGGMATGTFVISPLVNNFEPGKNLSFDLSPNPAKDVLRLTLGEPLNADATITMYNAAGQRVSTWVMASGATVQTLHVTDLPEGMYLVVLENDAVKGVRRVVLR